MSHRALPRPMCVNQFLKGIDKWKTRDSQQTRQAEENQKRRGGLSNKHRFLVHTTARALAELAPWRRLCARRKRITEQPNQTLSLFQKDLGAGQSECRQNKSSIIRDRQRQEASKALPEAQTETATATPAEPSERAAVAIRRRKCRNISFYFRSSRFLAERKVKMP